MYSILTSSSVNSIHNSACLRFRSRAHKNSHNESLTWSIKKASQPGGSVSIYCAPVCPSQRTISALWRRLVATLTYLGLVQHSSMCNPCLLENRFLQLYLGQIREEPILLKRVGLFHWQSRFERYCVENDGQRVERVSVGSFCRWGPLKSSCVYCIVILCS
ncbi:hypothetical protein BDV38DRAFT_250962 [Aspergillus pseudotamarii]|uniref:Uncharacterized protein n=1 Tax=Aspergillus pseudotamarii TaxID=132259 RepID=A0A5N6SM89_ASPPS|nr:uncharacterized protein BDV38DRAFT_250962 [Aspergillus pseudotamarii]KAE8135828.1 hypothetical protein BDV38DRAFT_250962 [Aspergillus pseudotamarii]